MKLTALIAIRQRRRSHARDRPLLTTLNFGNGALIAEGGAAMLLFINATDPCRTRISNRQSFPPPLRILLGRQKRGRTVGQHHHVANILA
jgi:hypothetical protein